MVRGLWRSVRLYLLLSLHTHNDPTKQARLSGKSRKVDQVTPRQTGVAPPSRGKDPRQRLEGPLIAPEASLEHSRVRVLVRLVR